MNTKVNNFLYEQESYEIRGACFEVWKAFRGIFKESVIGNSLKQELEDRGLKIENQKRIEIYYKKIKVGVYVPDFVVNEKIILEIKVKSNLTREDERQFWYYLRGSHYKLGFLVNFGPDGLDIRRRVYDEARIKYKDISINQRTHQRISASIAFSLVETMIVIGITASLTAMSLGYARGNKKNVALFIEQAKVAGALSRARSLALQGYNRTLATSGGGDCYGVYFNKNIFPNKIIVFRDINIAGACDGYGAGDEVRETFSIDAMIEILRPPVGNYVLFTPPYFEVTNAGDIILRIKNETKTATVNVGLGGDITMR